MRKHLTWITKQRFLVVHYFLYPVVKALSQYFLTLTQNEHARRRRERNHFGRQYYLRRDTFTNTSFQLSVVTWLRKLGCLPLILVSRLSTYSLEPSPSRGSVRNFTDVGTCCGPNVGTPSGTQSPCVDSVRDWLLSIGNTL